MDKVLALHSTSSLSAAAMGLLMVVMEPTAAGKAVQAVAVNACESRLEVDKGTGC
jgi:branched-subunit amino acid ABC-type transport system permease component